MGEKNGGKMMVKSQKNGGKMMVLSQKTVVGIPKKDIFYND